MNTSKTLLVSTAVVLALTLVLAPLAISEDALAKKSNKAKQIIEQSQKSKQNSQAVSGGSSVLSGNNFNFQDQFNKGNNALGQINN
jgi:lipopolysaccharide export LptBFGC system permease protein LptF